MKKLIILGAANPNVIRTIDSINSKKTKIYLSNVLWTMIKKGRQKVYEKRCFRYANFFENI